MASPIVLNPLLSTSDAEAIMRLWLAFGSYRQYSNEGFPTEFAPELAQRYDAAANFVRTGGRFGRVDESAAMLAARTNYFRETYSYGDDVFAPGVEMFRDHPAFALAAEKLHGRPLIVPAIVYANMLLPGQELAVHTDVPEFRGANRKVVPQWLLVAMYHSGLFDAWRMPIATGIAYFGHARGGALAYYPDGADHAPQTYEPRHNSAVVLDTDAVFHGVDRVEGDDAFLHHLRPGMRLDFVGGDDWRVMDGDSVVASFHTDDLRYSISWKAYCFADAAERAAWERHSDDLALTDILDTLIADLVARGRLGSAADRPDDVALGRMIIDEYTRFPTPAAG
jgi:hypothetical protein